ncbi:MAG: translesion DNA synthesis-associated protein ImuA [Betaproteobacteria bacterium]|nr:translesion DNA synthesis-associated protein ImuA [Betaproteobacteria bacterium]
MPTNRPLPLKDSVWGSSAVFNPMLNQHPDVWRASSPPSSLVMPSIASGHKTLDAQLPGGGWPVGHLTELLVRAMGVGELRLLAPALQRLTRANKQIIMLAPPQLPHAPALSALGIQLNQCLVVRARRASDRLWAIEQSLRSNHFGALLAWIDEPTPHEALRRFQLAARQAQGPVFLFRPLQAQDQPSPAPLRLALLPRQYPGLAVQLLKRRGPVAAEPIYVNLPIASRAMRPLEEAHALDRMPVPQHQSFATSHPTGLRSTQPH